MNYTLMHKEIPVLSFDIDSDGYITSVNEVYDKNHLPLSLLNPQKMQKTLLNEWWKGRSIPASRQNLQEALEVLGGETTDSLVNKSFGLSLSDHYWAKPVTSKVEWQAVNFFTNSFSSDVGKALFGTLDVKDSSELNLLSPDNTSDGWLQKRWIIKDGERILLKSGSGESQQEPFNEVLASECCKKLGINYVPYKIVKTENHFYSACPDFVSVNTELIPAWTIVQTLRKDNNTSGFNHLINCAEKIGISDTEKLKKDLCHMLALDFIVANTDRHFNNFGFLRNPDTLEWIGLAPIFDTGTSMFHDMSVYGMRNPTMLDSTRIKSKPFASNQKDQIKKLPCKEYCKDLDFSKLKEVPTFFENLLKDNQFMDEDKKHILCNVLKNRISEVERVINSPDKKIVKSRADDYEGMGR